MSRLERIAKVAHTVRHLRWEQVVFRLWHRLYRPRPDLSPAPRRRVAMGTWVAPVRRSPTLVGEWTFRFLNEEGTLHTAADWNDPQKPRLWLYNLHYFDDLSAAGAEQRTAQHRALIERWIADNPPGQGPGWEPYPLSLRVVNWVKWATQGNVLEDACAHSLAVQARWLRRRLEYHLLGNHLLANAKALVFAGLYFEGAEADSWLRTGLRLLAREVPEQVLADGGHFERSPTYHRIVLEDLLDLVNVCRAYGQEVPSGWEAAVARMLPWGAIMRHPDDEVAFFNDAALGAAPAWDELCAYARRLGLDGAEASEVSAGAFLLPDSGYAGVHGREATLFFDVAPVGPDYLPGHAHADTLSLELSLFGARVLVNSGTSTYAEGDERLRQRGTGAHNTIAVDGEDSSEVWRSFRVARRARVHDVAFDAERAEMGAWHDGYRRLPGRPVHARHLRLGEGELEVADTVSGDGTHRIEGAWHLHPSVEVHQSGADGAGEVELEILSGGTVHRATLVIEGPVAVEIEPATWHPEFGKSVGNRRIRFVYEGALPMGVVTRIAW